MLNKKNIFRFAAMILSLLSHTLILAQEIPIPGDGGPPPPDGFAPIDENLTVFLVIAILFGIYTIYKFNLKQKKPSQD